MIKIKILKITLASAIKIREYKNKNKKTNVT